MVKNRIIYLDFLRIFAILAVVMVHVATSQYRLEGMWNYSSCFWHVIPRWCVPVFVMISGTLFLDPIKNITINNILKKYILCIAIAFIVWSAFYTCINCITTNNFNFVHAIKYFIKGRGHLWFLYMISGLYLVTPLLRVITEKKDKNLLLYLLIICFFVSSIIPFINFIIPSTKEMCDVLINKIHLSFPVSFVGYFVLGYYLHNYVNIKNVALITGGLLFSLFAMIFADIYHVIILGTGKVFVNSFFLFVVLASIFIFLFVKKQCSQTKQMSKFILKMSDLTFGVFLIHAFFIDMAVKFKLFSSINSLLNGITFIVIPVEFITVIIVSFLSVFLFSKIPWVKKYCL
ncbi:MAG: acyltransferase family protein [Endomicrobiaceae bacterium]|nr:acyltransferase family protein [Endomicrobiaceae bacterium]